MSRTLFALNIAIPTPYSTTSPAGRACPLRRSARPGITRRRVMLLLKDMGIETIERTIGPAELMQAEEIISSGNHARVYPCNRIGQRDIGVGRIGRRLVTAYRDFAHSKN